MLKFYRYLFYRFYRRQRNPEVLGAFGAAVLMGGLTLIYLEVPAVLLGFEWSVLGFEWSAEGQLWSHPAAVTLAASVAAHHFAFATPRRLAAILAEFEDGGSDSAYGKFYILYLVAWAPLVLATGEFVHS